MRHLMTAFKIVKSKVPNVLKCQRQYTMVEGGAGFSGGGARFESDGIKRCASLPELQLI